MSGEDEKTQAQKTAENKPALPQPRPAPEKPQPKRQPVKSGEAQTAMGSSDMTPVAPQGDLAPAARQPPVEGDTIHYVRFSPETGGTGDHDMAGDPYLNAIKARVEHYRQYPPASEFPPIGKEVVIISILVEPTGQISQIKVLDPPTSDRVTEAARMMINLSSPFPPLPSSWGNYRASIEAEFLMVPSGTETR
jgi:outer membrane biosynthesis protein TonB